MKTKILNVLRKSDGYVSGQALCNMLGVSRTAVWKVINQLKEEGYVIEAVQNKGYHITQYPDILTSSEIMSQLTCVDTGSTTGIIREVVYMTRQILPTTKLRERQREIMQLMEHFI